MKSKKYYSGMHLLELLVVLAIISILASTSLSIYPRYEARGHRLEALTTLSKLAVRMESYHFEHGSYAGVSLPDLDAALRDNTHYRFVVELADDRVYRVAAYPLGSQRRILDKVLVLDSRGELSTSMHQRSREREQASMR